MGKLRVCLHPHLRGAGPGLSLVLRPSVLLIASVAELHLSSVCSRCLGLCCLPARPQVSVTILGKLSTAFSDKIGCIRGFARQNRMCHNGRNWKQLF